MLYKTEKFQKILEEKLWQIKVNKKIPVIQRGSYKNKPYGSLITDIDLAQNVYASESLIPILYRLANNRGDFIFLRLHCGTYIEFKFPWEINAYGSCKYSPEKTKAWLQSLEKKEIVDKVILGKIKNKLNSALSLETLLEVKSILRPYSEILWSREDLHSGIKIVRGFKYNLLDLMRSGHITIMRYVYIYENEICNIDFSLIDRRYIHEPSIIHEYYKGNNYKIFKSLKWYIKREYFHDYINTLNNFEKWTAIINRLNLIDTIKKYKTLSEDRIRKLVFDSELYLKSLGLKSKNKNKLNEILNIESKKEIENYKTKIQPKFKEILEKYLERGNEGRKKIDKKTIENRIRKGYECPFFGININLFNEIYTISKNYLLDFSLILNCINKVSELYDIDPQIIKDTIFRQDISIVFDKGEYIVKYIEKKIKFKKLKKAQLYTFKI